MKRSIHNMVKLRFPFDEPIDNVVAETMWATPLKNGNYRLENTSVYFELNYGDIVKAEYVDGFLEFQSCVLRQVMPQDEDDLEL